MDDFRVPPASYFDQRPETDATGARKRRKLKPSHPETPPEQEDDIVLSPEPDEPGEEQPEDYYSPSDQSEKND